MEIAGAIAIILIAFGVLIALVVLPIVMALRERRRSDRPFSVSRTISATFAPIGRAPVPIIGTGVLMLGGPTAVLQATLAPNLRVADGAVLAHSFGMLWGAGVLLGWTVGLFGQLMLLRMALDVFDGRRAEIGRAAATALRLFLPGLALYILHTVAIGLGMLLLIVPGIIVLVMWLLAVPVLVAERPGILGALARSAELTKGRRWRLLALLILYGVVTSVASGITGGALGAASAEPVSLGLVNAVTSTFTAVVVACGLAAIYRAMASEAGDTAALEEVFA